MVDLVDRKRRRFFHVNMLPTSPNCFAEWSAEGKEEEVPTWDGSFGDEYTIGEELTTEQRKELESVLRTHQNTLKKCSWCDNPGQSSD